MIQFGIFAALMLLVALCFVLIPMLVKRGEQLHGDEQTNIQLAKTKLSDLEAELAGGNLSLEQFKLAKDELEVSLYHDLQANKTVNYDESKGRWLAIPLLFAVPLVALALYSILGDMRSFDAAVSSAKMEPQTPKDPAGQAMQINAMVEKLAKRLESQPDDAEGWLRLGHSYKVLQRYPDAVKALRKAQALMGDKADVLLQLADAIAMESGGSLKGEATQLISKALTLEPNNDMGLWLSGMASGEAGDFQQAIVQWTKLQSHYKPEEDGYKEVQQLLDKANARLGKPAAAKTTTPSAVSTPAASAASTNAGSVHIKVELAEALKSKVSPEDAVIIYAQAVNGPKAPLAAV
ncbi:MAG: c-type cytochrome biogenesis protein CcmI, partial [Methylococcales bacterium]